MGAKTSTSPITTTTRSSDPAGKSPARTRAAGPASSPSTLAGNLYVDNWRHDVVRFANSEIPGARGSRSTPLAPTGLAVDPDTGDLYVAHRTYVSEYAAPVKAGDAPVATIGSATSANTSASPSPTSPPQGDLYVADAADNRVKVFDPATSLTTPVEEIDGAATPQGHFTYFVNGELDRRQQSRIALLRAPLRPRSGSATAPAGSSDRRVQPRRRLPRQITGITDAEPSGIAIEPSTGRSMSPPATPKTR